MAIIQLNGIISNIKGSIGGVTFSNVRNGIALKRKLSGKKNLSSKQLIALNKNKRANHQWTSLTFGQKNTWNDFASVYTFTNRFGQEVALTGFNWYSGINFNRIHLNQAVITVPPTYEIPAALPEFYVTMSTTSMVVQWSTDIDTATTNILLYASIPGRSQAQYNRGAYRLLDLTGIDVESSFDITAAWEAATGLTYTDISSGGVFTINVMIVPVSTSSYITGLGQTASSQIPFDGVGFWGIETDFEVQP